MVSGYDSVMNLIKKEKDKGNLLKLVEISLKVSRLPYYYNTEFPGTDVIKEAIKKYNIPYFYNLKKLVKYGILEHTKSSRGKSRAYYRMYDPDGVEKALKEIEGSSKRNKE